ncbi:MGMT family protein [bacterium]|nr:MGMT family protein [bacterium]
MTARQIVKILDPAPAPGHCVAADDLAGRIHDFLEGEPVDFNLHGIRLDRCPAFQKDVLHAESRIPRSAVSTYHRIACHLGKPGASRAVGNALARNPFPLIIPCHRAVRSDLTPGGFQGGSGMKRELLLMEGHRFDQSGRLTGPALYY